MNRICAISFILLGLASLMGCSGPATVHSDVPTQMPTLQLTNTDTPIPVSPPTEVDTPTPVPATAETPTLVSTVTPHPTPDWAPYEDEPFTIVFQRCGELWASEVGGQGEQPLTNEDMGTSERPCLGVGSFAISPDGRFVSYIVRDEHNVFVKVMDVQEKDTRVVGSIGESDPYTVFGWFFQQLAWWDETHVAYYLFEPPPREVFDATGHLKSLVLVNLETEESTTETVSTLQYSSPDGRYVLSGHDFRGLDPEYLPYQLYDRETGEQWMVTDEDVPAHFLGWSPGSRLMLFDLTYEWEVHDVLLVVDAETRARRVVTPDDSTVESSGAAWSPDSQTIAYLQCDLPTTACMNPELWLTSPDGVNRRRIPMEESIYCTQLSWTPDGSRLVFETTREPSIWSVRLDGTDLRPIADGQDPQVLPAP
jgi:WD40 repeat protein